MTILEWILILQLIVLATAGIMWIVIYFSSPKDSDELLYIELRAFWRTMLARHLVLDPIGPAKEKVDDDELLEEQNSLMDVSEEDALAALAREAESEAAEMGAPPMPRKGGKKGESVLPGRGGEVPNDVPVATLAILVASNTGTEKIVGSQGDELKIAVKTGAEDAASNKVVLDLVAKHLGLKRYQVTLSRGHYHANKVIRIAGMTQAQLQRKLTGMVG